MVYPQRRLRRLRRTPALRRLVAETRVTVDDLVAPLFVREGITEPQPIASLPGVVQHTRESLRKEVSDLATLGIPGVILFGVPASKDAEGSAPEAQPSYAGSMPPTYPPIPYAEQEARPAVAAVAEQPKRPPRRSASYYLLLGLAALALFAISMFVTILLLQ